MSDVLLSTARSNRFELAPIHSHLNVYLHNWFLPLTSGLVSLLVREYGHMMNRFTGKSATATGSKHVFSPTRILHLSNFEESMTPEVRRDQCFHSRSESDECACCSILRTRHEGVEGAPRRFSRRGALQAQDVHESEWPRASAR